MGKGNLEIRRVLITGISGSGGSYLAEYLVNNHPYVEVHGVRRWHSTSTFQNLIPVIDKVKIHECDLNDFGSTYEMIGKTKPDVIFHLAASANVHASFINPHAILSNNILGTSNLFEAIRLASVNPIVQLCSTSEVYGQVYEYEVPITEENPLRPSSPYAVSKVAQDLLGWTYFRSYGMPIIRTRMFAYINPRRRDLFATSFARQIARIECGLQKELIHGNLSSIRTLIDVRDAIESYWVAIMACEPGEIYNIGGSTTIRVGDFLELLKKRSRCPIPTREDPSLLRPADVTLQIPDTDKFKKATGWEPKCALEDSIDYLLSYWRNRVRGELDLFKGG